MHRMAKYVYRQPKGWVVKVKGKRSKFFAGHTADSHAEAVAWRNQALGTDPDQAPLTWEQDERTFKLQFRNLELEEAKLAAEAKVRALTAEIAKIQQTVEEYRSRRASSAGETEYPQFKVMDTVAIVDAHYLYHQGNGVDARKLRGLIEGMIGCRLSDYIYVSSLPTDETNRRRVEAYHSHLSSHAGANANIIAYEVKETTITCPRCSESFERRYQWAGDTAIATEITRWAVGRQVPRVFLVAGDGDFCYPAQVARNFCRELVVAGFANSFSTRLQGAATRVVLLDDYVPLITR